MIYKLIVNAAFLAIGYYVGKEVCRNELTRNELVAPRRSAAKSTGETPMERAKKTGT